jgi:hypothetical protein
MPVARSIILLQELTLFLRNDPKVGINKAGTLKQTEEVGTRKQLLNNDNIIANQA